MDRNTRYLSMTVLAAALLSLGVYAQQSRQRDVDSPQAVSADIPVSSARQRLAQRASDVGGAPAKAGPTEEEVGDVDSFGRNVVWLGLTDMRVDLSDACPVPGGDPDAACVVVNPAPALTAFNFEDLGHVTLPAKSAHSLLCYWFSPFLNITYQNPTAAAVVARLSYSPTLTIENPVLDDPALIDPSTGLPFGGSLITGMTSSERFEVPLAPGQQLFERSRDSAVCIAGFMSRKTLVLNYGLSEAQAKEFFKKETTVRLNISGTAQYVDNASLYYGLRIVGD